MTARPKRFATGLVPPSVGGKGRWVGRGWAAILDRPSAQIRKRYPKGSREIFILAGREATADKALRLIGAMLCVLTASPGLMPAEVRVRLEDADKSGDEGFVSGPVSFSTCGFPEACALAAKASRRRAWMYAVSLYQLSQRLHANDPMDLDPRYWPHDHRSLLPDDHVRYAYSIIASYAIIEQLGLEVRATQQKPSIIEGEWNPPVLKDLEARLEKAGTPAESTLLWMIRGGVTKLERKRRIKRQAKQEWARCQIRDSEVKVVDAINHLSWLRSKVASHRLQDTVRLLSVYDVASAHVLTRTLLLNSLGWPVPSESLEDSE